MEQLGTQTNDLIITSQKLGTGTLIATGNSGAAGIGSSGDGGTVTINGGTVTATGGNYSAGIGGGNSGNGGAVTINGGTVTANGGNFAAGIGGGFTEAGCNVTINGGTVTAIGTRGGAAIGAGYSNNHGTVTFGSSNFTVKAGADADSATETTTTAYAADHSAAYVHIEEIPAPVAAQFSASASKKVTFSPGNLYWDGDSFEFEANQYDFQRSWNANHVSHFCWSKTPSVAYAELFSDSGTSKSDVFFTNATENTAKVDFTVNGETGEYRTLSGDEWTYLLSTRTVNGGTGEGKSYQRATINSDTTAVYGMILYPDDYTAQTTATSYASAEWQTMETAGCVFLPAAGNRNNLGIANLTNGCYWSSMAVIYGEDEASMLYFNSSMVELFADRRDIGCLVRLVKDVPAAK